jgi:hypothetical protein
VLQAVLFFIHIALDILYMSIYIIYVINRTC